MAICILCEEHECKPNSKLPTCQLCRSSIGRWARRKPSEVLHRRRQLSIYDKRMEAVVEAPGRRKNVIPFKPRKRAA